jgi:hypothetical protein
MKVVTVINMAIKILKLGVTFSKDKLTISHDTWHGHMITTTAEG